MLHRVALLLSTLAMTGCFATTTPTSGPFALAPTHPMTAAHGGAHAPGFAPSPPAYVVLDGAPPAVYAAPLRLHAAPPAYLPRPRARRWSAPAPLLVAPRP